MYTVVMQKKALTLLKLVDYHHPLLRQVTKSVSFPLSAEDKQVIADMKYSIQPEQLKEAGAPWDAAVGMAANQWGIDKQIFLFRPDDSFKGFEVIINPSYEPLGIETNESHTEDCCWEGCFSVPLATGNVKRYCRIKVKYQNEKGIIIQGELEGFPARVWQHENDHLRGLLYDDKKAGKCLQKEVFSSKEEALNFRAQNKEA